MCSPAEGRGVFGRAVLDRALLLRALKALVPAIVLLFLVIGTIFMGLATPTEAAAMGALGSLGLAAANRRLGLRVLREAMEQTTILTSFAIFILIGATIFTLVFRGLDGDLWVEHLLTGLPGGQTGFLVFVNVLIFLLSFFLDFFEIAFILLPLLGLSLIARASRTVRILSRPQVTVGPASKMSTRPLGRKPSLSSRAMAGTPCGWTLPITARAGSGSRSI